MQDENGLHWSKLDLNFVQFCVICTECSEIFLSLYVAVIYRRMNIFLGFKFKFLVYGKKRFLKSRPKNKLKLPAE